MPSEALFTGVGEWLQDMNKPHSYHSKILVINPGIPKSKLASCENGVFLSTLWDNINHKPPHKQRASPEPSFFKQKSRILHQSYYQSN